MSYFLTVLKLMIFFAGAKKTQNSSHPIRLGIVKKKLIISPVVEHDNSFNKQSKYI